MGRGRGRVFAYKCYPAIESERNFTFVYYVIKDIY